MTDLKLKPELKGSMIRTGLFFAVYILLYFVKIPGINYGELRDIFTPGVGLEASPPWSVFSVTFVGLLPFFIASLWVEIGAFLVPRWQPLRFTLSGRAKLFRTSLLFTLPLLLFHSHSYVINILSLPAAWKFILIESSFFFKILVMLSQMTGTMLLIWLAVRISREGLVNGFGLLFSLEVIQGLAPFLEFLFDHKLNPSHELRYPALLVSLMIIVAIGTAKLLNFRARIPFQSDHQKPDFQLALRPLVAGIIPLTLGLELFNLGQTLSRSHYLWGPISVVPFIAAGLAVTTICNFWLGWCFHRPSKICSDFQNVYCEKTSGDIKRSLFKLGTLSLGVFLVIGWLPSLLDFYLIFPNPTDYFSIICLTAFALDGVDSVRYHRHNPTATPIALFGRIYLADRATDILARHNIPNFVHNKNLRGLFHFFAPYLPMVVMVPTHQLRNAWEKLNEHPGFQNYLVPVDKEPGIGEGHAPNQNSSEQKPPEPICQKDISELKECQGE